MSLRVYERLPKELPPQPNIVLRKEFVFSDKPLLITAKLDKGVFSEGDTISLSLMIQRKDHETHGHGVKKIKVMAIQQVSHSHFVTLSQ
jgi:hypothetical protein